MLVEGLAEFGVVQTKYPYYRQGQSEQVKTKINSVQFTVHNVYLATCLSDQLKAQFKSVQLTIQFSVELAKS